MIGEAGISVNEAMSLTLKRFLQIYDGRIIANWDHTSTIACFLYNLTAVFHNANSKSKIKPQKDPAHFHPYRDEKPRGIRVTADSIGVLRTLANSLGKR